MKPNSDEVDRLVRELRLRHGQRFNELSLRATQFADYLRRLDSFRCIGPDPLLQKQHVGRVIVDGVFQVGHDFEKQVRKRVELITQKTEAVTVSGFIRVLKQQGITNLLDWHSASMQHDLLGVANFFAMRGIDTYLELQEWLTSEEHRDSLLSVQSGLGGNSTFRVAEKTADYFRVLVSLWDAVAVDKGINQLLAKARIVSVHSRYFNYKERRAIVQLAALELDCRPIDLDQSIYHYYINSKPIKEKIKRFKYCLECGQKIPKQSKYCSECGKRQADTET